MNITSFDELLQAARQQSQPQRLLLVFAGATLPEHATPEQRERFEDGESGELSPLMCVDKDPAELRNFESLAAEATVFEQPWVLVFAAALSGTDGAAPADSAVASALERMVENVRSGELARFIPFDRQGQAVQVR
jgi:hypothetical protein